MYGAATSYITMWILFLFFSACAASRKEDSNPKCGPDMFSECEKHQALDDMPSTEAEFQEFCKSAVNYFECAVAVADQCEDTGNDDRIAYAREMRSNIIRVCEKQTKLNKAVLDNLTCFKKNIGAFNQCPDLNKEWVTAISGTYSDSNLNPCISAMYGIACFASNAGRLCGNEARDVIIDIAQGYDFPFVKCPRDAKSKLLTTIVEVIDLEAEIGELEKRRKQVRHVFSRYS